MHGAMAQFHFFPELCEDVKVRVTSFLDTKDGLHLMMTSTSLHTLISLDPRCWQGWQPIMTQDTWEGHYNPNTFREEDVRKRQELANAARDYQWFKVRNILAQHPEWVNCSRLGGLTRFAPLHQAAHGEAPMSFVRYLVYGLGAWRTLKTSNGQRAVDIAQAVGCHHSLVAMLQPPPNVQQKNDSLEVLEEGLHEIMRGSCADLLTASHYRLPPVAILSESPKLYCAISGMYGGFLLQLAVDEDNGPKIVAESWCRVVDGSGQRHEITANECKLVAEGF